MTSRRAGRLRFQLEAAFFSVLVFASALVVSRVQGQTGAGVPQTSPVELTISGPRVVHVGDSLQFTATLTNRSPQAIAVPSEKSQDWILMEGQWWNIVDKSGKRLKFKPSVDVPIDHMVGMPTFQESDFVLLKPGEKIDYTHEVLGDPSDKFVFPGRGSYFVSLSWKFCAPRAEKRPDDTTAYTCGVTMRLSESLKQTLFATPSYEVGSNVWTISLK